MGRINWSRVFLGWCWILCTARRQAWDCLKVLIRVARVSVSAFSGMGEESAENSTDPEGEVGAEARSSRESGVDELSVGSVWCSDLKELEEKATEE